MFLFHYDQNIGAVELRVIALHNGQDNAFFSILYAEPVSQLIRVHRRTKILARSNEPTARKFHGVNVRKPHTSILADRRTWVLRTGTDSRALPRCAASLLAFDFRLFFAYHTLGSQ